jgi:uncharacterized protein (TIGR01777 family)
VKIAVTGSSGFIGTALVPGLCEDGHVVVRLVRRQPAAADEVPWDPGRRQLDPAHLADVDAVVHLAGVGVGDRRWTEKRKRLILASRIDGTTTVSEALAKAEPRPRTLVSASGVDYYADLGDTAVDESGPTGSSFLAEVCRAWEGSTVAAEQAGVRVAVVRTGLVCGQGGGLLRRLLIPARLGLGGPLASGRQWWSWISLADYVGGVRHVLSHPDVAGPVNLTGPAPVTNADFARILGRVLRRPAVLRVPAFALRLALDGFADEAIVSGHRVLPRVLESSGYRFRHETAERALRWATRREG